MRPLSYIPSETTCNVTSQRATASMARRPFRGVINVPGDKSISHRALIFAALAEGISKITGLLEGEDVLCSAHALRSMGITIERTAEEQSAQEAGEGRAQWTVTGVGLRGLKEPDDILNVGNSGTSARLFLGLTAGQNITTFITGDASLRRRPMARVTKPLSAAGAQFISRTGGLLPIAVVARPSEKALAPIEYISPIASAQVKSALLLAGLPYAHVTEVREPRPTRDHTERFLQKLGIPVRTRTDSQGQNVVTITGGQAWQGFALHVPGDISSAAFMIVAALLIPESDILIQNVGLNPTRTGVLETLQDMGGDITIENARMSGAEPVGDVRVRHSTLYGVDVPEARIPSMIDECPIVAIAAACAKGTTRLQGVGELRVKESDRLAMMATGLEACGVQIKETDDSLHVYGTGTPPRGNKTRGREEEGETVIHTALDHRIAMSFLVLGQVTESPISIDDSTPIATSFPNFIQLIQSLGGTIAYG